MKIRIIFTIACMISIVSVHAQNPIDEFLKNYDSKEGVTSVSMSQQMLQSVFNKQGSLSVTSSQKLSGVKHSISVESINIPEVYRSVTITEIEKPKDIYAKFMKLLTSLNYEQYMEINKDNNNIIGYYLKKLNDNSEIIVIRQENKRFSAIYIKGDIEINQLDRYLSQIRMAMMRLEVNNKVMSMPLSLDTNNDIFSNLHSPDSTKVSMKNNYLIFNGGYIKVNKDSTQTLILKR